MNKSFQKKCIAIFLGAVIAVGASYVSASTARPSSSSTSSTSSSTSTTPTFINTGTTPQQKNGQLNLLAFIAGDYASTTTANVAFIDNLGAMAVGKNTTATGIALDIKGTTGIGGTIRSSELKNTLGVNRPICTDDTGKISLCSLADYKISGTGNFMVPDGVTELTVEVYGGGGAGWGSGNSDGDGLDDGDSSYFKGSNVTMIADGGTGAPSLVLGGKGGTATVSGSAVSNTPTKVTGGNGDSPSAGSAATPSQYGATWQCGGTNYFAVKGGNGDNGAKGGRANNGSTAYGGGGGFGGPLSSSDYTGGTTTWSFLSGSPCTYKDKTSDDLVVPSSLIASRYGSKGAKGSMGGGGGGRGGDGGVSAFTTDSSCSAISGKSCYGELGAAAGGAGGYAKATISAPTGQTLAGQTFFIKIGGGGNPQNPTTTASGSGGDGYIKITYK